MIPVGVLGMNAAAGDTMDFDVSQIDPASLKLGIGGAQNIAVPLLYDIDEDFQGDAVFGFNTADTGIFCGDTEVSLTGETITGEEFVGSDSITTTDCAYDGSCHS